MNLDLLRSIELFQDMTNEQFNIAAAMVTERSYSRGDTVFREGDARDKVCFVKHGLIKIYRMDQDGREQIFNIVGVGGMFPFIGWTEPAAYTGTAEAMMETSLFEVPCDEFESFVLGYADLSRCVMQLMNRQIHRLQTTLLEVSMLDAHERVSALIRHLAEDHGIATQFGIRLDLPVTHSDMAQMVGMTRESVNRIWNELRREGVIRPEADRHGWLIDSEWAQTHM